jgi:hypothetical protein
MSNAIELLRRLADWWYAALERAQARERDTFVAQAGNAREVSQRIHRLEQAHEGLGD